MRTYEQISDILCAIPDEWCFGTAPKARFTY